MTRNLSKDELLAIVEDQAAQIRRYELRLRDTVAACKNFMKQNEALQASLQVLNQQKKPPSGDNAGSSAGNFNESGPEGPGASASSSSTEITADDLRRQIETLTQSLATISSEKARIEQLVVAQKKSLRAEYDGKIDALNAEKEKLLEEISDLRSRLSSPNFSSDHVEIQHHHRRDRSARSEPRDDNHSGLMLIERLRQQLKEAEAKLFLQQQVNATKEEEIASMEAERERADRAELMASEAEIRLRTFETRIAELTGEIGRSEQAALKDQQTIQKLEARLRDFQLNALVGTPKQQQTQQQQPQISSRTASFGTQTDVSSSALWQSHPTSLSKPVEADHSHCLEKISTLEGALAMARKDFADAVARSWLATASNPNISLASPAIAEERQTPDLLLRPAPQLRPTECIEIPATQATNEVKAPSEASQNKEASSYSHDHCSEMGQQYTSRKPRLEQKQHTFDDSFADEELAEDQELAAGSGQAAPLLFYETELARCNRELKEIRASSRRVERRFRETEQRLVADKLELQQKLGKLQGEVDELRRRNNVLPPDSAKLEFIRQVLMRHFSTADASVRSQTAKTLATALSFPADFAPHGSALSTSSSSTGTTVVSRFFKS